MSNPDPTATLSLREITKETAREIMRLQVGPGQDRFVASNAVSIAQAYFERETAWFRAIYADDVPVGFLMLEDKPSEGTYYLWRFMIDARYQGLGFGKRAIDLIVAHVRTRPGATELTLSCVPGEGGPGPFYERLGFVYTGEVEDEELVMKLDLGAPSPLAAPGDPSTGR